MLWNGIQVSGSRAGTRLPGQTGPVRSVAFGTLDEGILLAGGTENGQVWLWDLARDAEFRRRLVGGTGPVTSIAFGNIDGRILLATGEPDGVRLWDLTSGKQLSQRLGGRNGIGRSLAFGTTSDGRTLLASGSDDGVSLWDPRTLTQLDLNVGHSGPITSLDFGTTPEGRSLLASGGGDGVLLWKPLLSRGQFRGRISSGTLVAFGTAKDGRAVLASGGEDGVSLWDPDSGLRRGGRLARDIGPVTSMVLGTTTDGQPLLASGGKNGVSLCEPHVGGRDFKGLPGNSGPITSLAFGTRRLGDRLLAAGAESGLVWLWDPIARKQIGPPLREGNSQSPVTSVALCTRPQGQTLLASGSQDGVVLWELSSPSPKSRRLDSNADPVTALAFGTSKGRTLLATGSDTGQICLWDALSGRRVSDPIFGHNYPVAALAFGTTSDGETVLVATDGGTIDMWAVDNGQPITPPAIKRPVDAQLRQETLAVRDDPTDQDAFDRDVLAHHLHRMLDQLTGDGSGENHGTAIVHIDGRWGSGKTTLVKLLHRLIDPGTPLADRASTPALAAPIVVGYDAWRESAIAPEWWSLATAINKAVRAERAGVTRFTMAVAGTVLRVSRSRPALVAIALLIATVGTRVAGLWREASLVSAWLTALTAVAAVGLAAGRVLFWTSPAFGRLYARADENPLGEIANIVERLRRWSPRTGLAHRLADTLLGIWTVLVLLLTGYVLATHGSARVSADGTVAWLEQHLLPLAITLLVLVVVGTSWRWRRPVDRNGRDGSNDTDTHTSGTTFRGYPRGLASLAGVAVVSWTAISFGLSPTWTAALNWHPEAWAVGAIVLGVAGHLWWITRGRDRPRRPVVVVIDDLDRCGADRTVKLMETVHTLLRHNGRPSLFWRWRAPASLIVLVLADGRWVRTAFETAYRAFETLGSEAHGLGADFLQKMFDHTVLIPALDAHQVTALLEAITSVEPEPNQPAETSDTQPADPPSSSPVKNATSKPDPRRLNRADYEQVKEDTSETATNARIAHLLTQYGSLMPANPRLIKRIANAWGMLKAVHLHMYGPSSTGQSTDHIARAAIMFVRFPSLVDELLSCAAPPSADPDVTQESSSTESPWLRPEIQQLLTHGTRVQLSDIARCYGRQFAPARDESSPAGY